MKIFFKTFIVLSLMIISVTASARRLHYNGGHGTLKHKNLFKFKTEKKLVGAQVEVFYSNGDLVTVQTLQRKKMIIDFSDAKFGTYTIRVSKGNRIEDFQYIKQ